MKKLLIIAISFFALQCNTRNENGIANEILARANQESAACKRLDILDAEMQLLIQKIKTQYRTEELFAKRFEMSQVYWVQYRDRHIKALYPKDWNTFYRKEYSKEVFNECKCEEINRMTINRIKELVMYLEEDMQEGNCPSIWNQ